MAEPWFKVSHEEMCWKDQRSRSGNLLFCNVPGRRVLRLTQLQFE
jgi:hypothetical protein